MSMIPLKMYDVGGRFCLPGTNTVFTYSARVLSVSIQQAAKDLVPAMNEKFRDELKNKHAPSWSEYKISSGFVLGNLKFRERKTVKALSEAEQAALVTLPVVSDQTIAKERGGVSLDD